MSSTLVHFLTLNTSPCTLTHDDHAMHAAHLFVFDIPPYCFHIPSDYFHYFCELINEDCIVLDCPLDFNLHGLRTAERFVLVFFVIFLVAACVGLNWFSVSF